MDHGSWIMILDFDSFLFISIELPRIIGGNFSFFGNSFPIHCHLQFVVMVGNCGDGGGSVFDSPKSISIRKYFECHRRKDKKTFVQNVLLIEVKVQLQ